MLDLIRERGRISRVELAEVTGLTQATISTVVRSLIEDGLVDEPGEREYTGGKPRSVLVLRPMARCAVGVQLGADWAVIAVADAAGSIVVRTRIRGARDEAPQHVIERIATAIDRLVRAAGVPREAVVGLGLAVPGVLDLEAGLILDSRSLPTWRGYLLRDALTEATGLESVLDNHAVAAAIGEFWVGSIPDSVAHCTVFMGANLGVGIVLGGSVYRGASGNTGAIARLRTFAGPGGDGDSVEELAGPGAVASRARAALARGRTAAFELGPPGDPFADFAVVATAAIHGDPMAISLIEDSAEHLSDAVLTLANILDLDSIVLAGPAFAVAGPIYLELIRRRIEQDFFAKLRHQVAVQLSSHAADAGALGAAALVLQRELAPRDLGLDRATPAEPARTANALT